MQLGNCVSACELRQLVVSFMRDNPVLIVSTTVRFTVGGSFALNLLLLNRSNSLKLRVLLVSNIQIRKACHKYNKYTILSRISLKQFILEHMFFYKVCSTQRDLSNEPMISRSVNIPKLTFSCISWPCGIFKGHG